MEENKIINKFVDFIFSKNNLKYLILLFIIGFILRVIVANNISPNADEMLHAPHAINFINSGKLQIMDQDPIWFFLTDLSYKIFGISMFSARFLSVLFGSLSILILYLIVKLLYNKKIALISSVLITFSSFHILMSLAEMDVTMIFFVLLSLYFFIKHLKENENKDFILSTIFLGISILVKQISIMFIPALIIYYIYHKIKLKEKIDYKKILIFVLILFIISVPVLTFNYLLYKDKKLVDLQFSRFLGIAKETYKPIEATIQPFKLDVLFSGNDPGIIKGGLFFWQFDKLILILGILGFLISIIIKRDFWFLMFLCFLFPFIFLSGTSLLEYHFIFGIPILAIFGALFIDFISNKLSKFKINSNLIISILLIFIIIFNFYFLIERNIFSKGEVTKMMEYNKNIEKDSLVIVDSRIYRGRIVWMFNDQHFLESSYFPDFLNNIKNLEGEPKQIKTYFVECTTDDCGWGTISNQQGFNTSMEQIVDFFKKNSNHLKTISTRDNEHYFDIYSKEFLLKDSVLDLADSTHEWFYYPLRYNKESFDDYKTKNLFDKILDLLAHFILYIEVLFSLLTVIFLIYLVFKEENEVKHNNSSI